MNLTKEIKIVKDYFAFRGLKPAGGIDAPIWLFTETAELMDAVMRREPGWVRNNVKDDGVKDEIGDCLMMLLVHCDNQSIDEINAYHHSEETLKFATVELSRWAGELLSPVFDQNDLEEFLGYLNSAANIEGTTPLDCMLSKMKSKGFVPVA